MDKKLLNEHGESELMKWTAEDDNKTADFPIFRLQ